MQNARGPDDEWNRDRVEGVHRRGSKPLRGVVWRLQPDAHGPAGRTPIARAGVPLASVNKIDVQFSKFIYLDCPVALRIAERTEALMRADLTIGALPVMILLLRLGPRKGHGEQVVPSAAPVRAAHGAIPDSPAVSEMADMAGWLESAAPPGAMATAFPWACQALGAERITGLMPLS